MFALRPGGTVYCIYGVSPPRDPGQNPGQKSDQKLDKNLTKNLTPNPQKFVRQFDRKLSEKKTETPIEDQPKAPPPKHEIANKPIRSYEKSLGNQGPRYYVINP